MLLDPVCLGETLLKWLPVLERTLGPAALGLRGTDDSVTDGTGEERDDLKLSLEQQEESSCSSGEAAEDMKGESGEKECDSTEEPEVLNGSRPEPVQVVSPKPVPSDLMADLTHLATLYTELSCFRKHVDPKALGCTTFLCRYFFLLDQERVRRMCVLCYREQPQVQRCFIEAMLGRKRRPKTYHPPWVALHFVITSVLLTRDHSDLLKFNDVIAQ